MHISKFLYNIHADPNPPTNLSALMTSDSQGFQVYIEWKVYRFKSTTISKALIQDLTNYHTY